MDENLNSPPPEESDSNRQIIVIAMLGVVVIGVCALFFLGFLWFQSGQISLFANFFPSPTATRTVNAPRSTQTPNVKPTQHTWIKPAQAPTLASLEETKTALDSGVDYLESFATSFPDMPDINQPGDVYVFDIPLDESTPLLWSYGWCTTTQEILEDNFKYIQLVYTLNGTQVPLEDLLKTDSQRDDGGHCREYSALVNEWPAGEHHLEVAVTFTKDINDGWNLFPAGTHTFKYIVTIKR